ncbi:MAG: hypothetical protein ABIJ45_07680 [Candidatus Zixiibacteriota bacterium]
MANFSKSTIGMIYLGTLLLSVLSFFTTFQGMTILLDPALAFVGAFGLQIAMLGIAWNLMKLKNNRAYYLIVFLASASFSILFSYANFDSSLKSKTRLAETRAEYSDIAHSTLAQYGSLAQKTAQRGRYQVDRIRKLTELEQSRGWATIIDEGSNDYFIQTVIDGARKSVASWENSMDTDYRQGRGKGLIVNYFESRVEQTEKNVEIVNRYLRRIDSISLAINNDMPVLTQYDLINKAYISFPISEVNLHLGYDIDLPAPPSTANYIESPQNRQQAFMLVLKDLISMDQLTLFSLLLAIIIDLIIILMALAGSQASTNEELIFERIKSEASRQIKKIDPGNSDEIDRVLFENLIRYKQACNYNLAMLQTSKNYKKAKNKYFMKLTRGPENAPPVNETIADLEFPRIVKERLKPISFKPANLRNHNDRVEISG